MPTIIHIHSPRQLINFCCHMFSYALANLEYACRSSLMVIFTLPLPCLSLPFFAFFTHMTKSKLMFFSHFVFNIRNFKAFFQVFILLFIFRVLSQLNIHISAIHIFLKQFPLLQKSTSSFNHILFSFTTILPFWFTQSLQ